MEIKLDYAALAGIEEAIGLALNEAANVLKGDIASAAVMPFDTGDMQNNKTFVEGVNVNADESSVSLITDGPYARRLYYNPQFDFQQGKNANARGLWLEPWLSGGEHEDFAPTVLEQALERRLPK